MKRSTVVKLLASEIMRRNTDHYSYNEKEHASDVLKFLEQLGLVKPTHRIKVPRMCMMGSEYEDEVVLAGWERE